jgi:hypothetical protein
MSVEVDVYDASRDNSYFNFKHTARIPKIQLEHVVAHSLELHLTDASNVELTQMFMERVHDILVRDEQEGPQGMLIPGLGSIQWQGLQFTHGSEGVNKSANIWIFLDEVNRYCSSASPEDIL